MPLMDKLREPAHECLNEVHTVMESVACALVNDSFSRFPTLVDEISSSILSVIEKVFYCISNIFRKKKPQRCCWTRF
jgi:hypothetical protein